MRMKALFGLIVVALAIGCGDDGTALGDASVDAIADAGSDVNNPDVGTGTDANLPGDRCEAESPTRITGTVNFPNGELPVSGAFVYVLRTGQTTAARSGECGQCLDGASVQASTTTGSDGTFELTGVLASNDTLIVEKGGFQRTIDLSLTACEDNALDAGELRLPQNSTEGVVPKIAVVTGLFDRLDQVLSRLGLTEFDIFDGEFAGLEDEYPPATELLADMAVLQTYDIVLLNCGTYLDDPSEYRRDTFQTISENLGAFVTGGGRLYVTDQAYDLFEVAVPAAVDFYAGGPGFTDTPEATAAAEEGDDHSDVPATVLDPALNDWLGKVDALSPDGTLVINDLTSGWAAIEEASPDRSKVWVEALVATDPLFTDDPPQIRPLTVSTENGCGRALFTSYHTHDNFMSEGGPLVSQELVLAYTIFEVGTCIEDPVLF